MQQCRLSYRDVEELLVERGVKVDLVSGYRCVQRFTPPLAEAVPALPARRREPLAGCMRAAPDR
jgi:transposase-like protein